MKGFLAAALLFAALGASGSGRAQACVTLVADLVGNVTAADRASSKPAERWPVQLLQCLPAGRVLILDEGARTTLFYPSSGEAVSLRGPGGFEIGASAVRPLSNAAAPSRLQLNAAFRDIKLDRSRLAPAGVRMRDPRLAAGVVLLEPRGVVLEGDVLVFRWQPVEGAQQYRFRLANFRREQVLERLTEENQIVLPAATRLAPGERMLWRVEVASGSGQSRSQWQEFVIATPQARALASRIDSELAAPSAAERNLREVLLLQQMMAGQREP